ncbi:DUF3048 domain-containing protein [Cytobacillus purgationiresistens]|uniref:Lipoprotein YerB n=1 Tax=Cytobacillus purgationiresistens TaxID=863449 RepID=A0ABU0ASB2_9BACI|nr:DUF3048 domain-containing protein [Cytobacillus purgationiresistens]MDQ0272930.1 hypothetical protein [Cytobacillus purgationiresistens]
MLKKWMAVSAITMLLVSGCSKSETDEDLKDEKSGAPEQAVDANEEGMPSPLTGLQDNREEPRRSFAVMINNHPNARPQSGLDKADIVYEMLAEGEVTRFLAIYESEQPQIVGPVRSARDYYIELAKAYDSIFIAHGNSPEAKKLLDQGYVDSLNGLYYDGTLFERVSFRKAPHNSYITFDHIKEGALEKGYDMEIAPSPHLFLTKEEAGQIDGQQATAVSIEYSTKNPFFNVTYQYDESLEKYKRASNDELTVDNDSGDPVLLSNVFIIETPHQVVDGDGRRDIDLSSGGRGYLLQRGRMSEVNWINKEGRILPVIDGKEQGLVQGKTWINVVPADPGLESSIVIDNATTN